MTETAETKPAPIHQDIVRRLIPRELPCKLDDEEFTRIARQRAAKEAERDQLVNDLKIETDKRKSQIKEHDDEIGKMGRELHTGYQDRTVKCNDVFVKAPDGTGWIHTIRTDTDTEVERRPATAHETQRYLPTIDGPGGGLLGMAERAQRSAQSDVPAEEPGADLPPDEEGEGDEDDGDGDDDAGESKPKRGSKKKGK